MLTGQCSKLCRSPLPIACPSRPRRAVRPAAAGAPPVASAPPLNAVCASAAALAVASSVRGSREGYALWRYYVCTARIRPYTLAFSSQPNPAVKRRPNGGRLFTLREVQRRRWAPLTSTLGQPNANANRRMSESFVALPLPIACPSRPRRAVRPTAAGAPSVASAPP